MTLKQTLNRLLQVILEEAERNQMFEVALNEALQLSSSKQKRKINKELSNPTINTDLKRSKNRRSPAKIDPIQVVREGEDILRNELKTLSLEQLRDIVAEYGMDPGRLVMKWVTTERVIEKIVEMSIQRAQKGNAFRKPIDNPPSEAADAEVFHSNSQSTDETP